MSYTTIDKPSDYFNTVLYTGNGSTQSITGVGFQPDWIWGKNRSATGSHNVIDSVRGVSKIIYTNLTDGEATDTSSFNAFGSDGFSVGSQSNVNGNGNSIVAWNWKAGTSFTNDTSSTGIGTIDSTGSFNNDSGFSIVSYTGTGSAGTIKHGLNSELACYIIKQRNTTGGWIVYHKGNTSSPQTDYLRLDKTDATVDDAIFNDTAPTSSVFSIGTNAPVNTSSGTYIAYCFAEKKGYSKFGSYTGNGNADGAFVYTGFKPAFVMVKATTAIEHWNMHDNKRDPINVCDAGLKANENHTEEDADRLDFVSNGFKHRSSSGGYNSSNTFIYMAFAESPFVSSTGVPATAR